MCGQDTTVMRWNWIDMDYGPSWEQIQEKREKTVFTLIHINEPALLYIIHPLLMYFFKIHRLIIPKMHTLRYVQKYSQEMLIDILQIIYASS